MKSRTWIACIACIAIGFILSGLSQPQLIGQAKSPAVRVKWEYIFWPKTDPIQTIEQLGDAGWEMIGYVPAISGNHEAIAFKRHK